MVPKAVEKKRKREEPESETEDQSAALLKGFESSGEEDASGEERFKQGQDVPALPDATKLNKKLKLANKQGEGVESGVVYVGYVRLEHYQSLQVLIWMASRIPHGFYEHEMRAYFSQFGDIRRLRLSRNRKTGQSKHYAFLEFASSDVAKIVADTMNNYLMFGHILKCRIVPKEQVHENLWKGADKRFKKVPWSKMEGRRLAMGMGEAGWEKRIEGEKQRRKTNEEKLKAIGYEFEAPVLKGVADLKDRSPEKVIKAPGMDEGMDVPASDQGLPTKVVVSEEVTTNTAKKHKKRKAEKVEVEEKVEVKAKKAKQPEKSAKSDLEKQGKKAYGEPVPAVGTKEARGKETKKEKLGKTKRTQDSMAPDTRKVKKAKKASV